LNPRTRDLVRHRAGGRCEYCFLRQQDSELIHHIEHILARKHGGTDTAENLALACQRCNLRKGANLTGVDPVDGRIVGLFHPRRDEWDRHFRWRDTQIIGLTPLGRATVHVLALNDARRIALRGAAFL
jgi:5-methylcytosine-specific restriction endonuclease McrA